MKTALIALAALPLLGGCALAQQQYDARADAECDQLPNANDRVACKRAAQDAEIARRADKLGGN